jgi:hypothetical protein
MFAPSCGCALPGSVEPAEKRRMTSEAQSSNSVLLVRPASFGFHAEATRSNAFAAAAAADDVGPVALAEFDGLAERLARAGVDVLVLDDSPDPAKPDAAFPNNWVSFHADGTMVLYPMATAARRLERRPERLATLLKSAGFEVRRTIDLSAHEQDGHFLEGTGSLVLDRRGKRAFANLSPRTSPKAIADFDALLGYSTYVFDARDRAGRPIYHSNVLLSLGTGFALLCRDAVVPKDRKRLVEQLESTGRELILVDYDQLRQFACNAIELRNGTGDPLIALSSAARASFRPDQLRALERHGALVETAIPTIEAVGGGSVRCMIADIHLPRGG